MTDQFHWVVLYARDPESTCVTSSAGWLAHSASQQQDSRLTVSWHFGSIFHGQKYNICQYTPYLLWCQTMIVLQWYLFPACLQILLQNYSNGFTVVAEYISLPALLVWLIKKTNMYCICYAGSILNQCTKHVQQQVSFTASITEVTAYSYRWNVLQQ